MVWLDTCSNSLTAAFAPVDCIFVPCFLDNHLDIDLILILIESHNDNALGFYTSFGIKAIENLSDLPLVYVEDVFTDIETAQEYISLFNEEQLDLIHLEEIIEYILHLC